MNKGKKNQKKRKREGQKNREKIKVVSTYFNLTGV